MRRITRTPLDRGVYDLTGCDGSAARLYDRGFGRGARLNQWVLHRLDGRAPSGIPVSFPSRRTAQQHFSRKVVGRCPAAA